MNSNNNNIRLSPHKICLCAVIDHYLNAQINQLQKKLLSSILIKYIKNPDSHSEPSLYEFILELRKTRISDAFITDDLIRIITFETIDDLHQFFCSIKLLFEKDNQSEDEDELQQQQKSYLEIKSILGMFVKKVLLIFHQSLFDGLISLFNQMQSYIDQFNYFIEMRTKDKTYPKCNLVRNKISFLSPIDKERFVNEEISNINNLIGKVNPLDLKEHIEIIKSILPDVNKSRYIDLILSLNHMDYEQAVEELHRYFDYCNSDGNKSNNSLLPYAVFNLSKLHYHFGHYEQSYLSLQETIRIAQERNDNSCLALSLHMLSKFQHKSIILSIDNIDHFQAHNQLEILDKGIRRASDLDMNSLSSLNLLSKTSLNLTGKATSSTSPTAYTSTSTTSTTPSTTTTPSAPIAVGITNSSSIMNKINSNISASSTSNNINTQYFNDIFLPLENSQLINKSNNLSIIQMKSSVWEMFGNLELANYFTELSFRFNNNSQLNEFIHSNPTHSSKSTKDSIISYCNLALNACKKGDYKTAQNTLDYCIKEYPYHSHIKTTLLFTSLVIMFEISMAENRIESVHTIIESLLPLLNRLSPDDSEQPGWPHIFYAYSLIGRYYIKKKEYHKAHQFINESIEVAKLNGYEYLSTELHILLAQLFQHQQQIDDANNNNNTTTTTIGNNCNLISMQSGLNNMLYSLSLSEQYGQPKLNAESNLLLANTHLESGDFERVYSLLENTLPMVLQDCYLQAKLYLLYAKTIFRESQFNKNVDKKQALDYLEKSQSSAKKLLNKDMLNEIAIYFNELIK